nr:site-specific integrase [uncultured Pseudogulbenkiania sp.]
MQPKMPRYSSPLPLWIGEKAKRSFDEASLRWLEEMEHKKSIDDDRTKIAHFRPFFNKLTLDQITADHARDALKGLGRQYKKGGVVKPAGQATKNRYLAWLRSLLRKAEREWGWIDKAPYIKLHGEAKRRVRWLTREEAWRLHDALPEHLQPVFRFALATGLRRSNIVGLKWSQIDLQRHVAWIHPDEAKAGIAIGVALNATAIEAIRAQQGKHKEFVFTYRGNPMRADANTAWRRALKTAGIDNFRFHDIRHTWASWLVQSGVGLAELQEMWGWESADMVRRYAHLAPDHLLAHSQKIDVLWQPNDTITTQKRETA